MTTTEPRSERGWSNDSGQYRKQILGYTDRLTVRPTERIEFKISAPAGSRYQARLVRLINGDTHSTEAGFREIEIDAAINGEHPGRSQPVDAGSCVVVELPPSWPVEDAFTIALAFQPTLPLGGRQHLIGRWDAKEGTGWSLRIDDGRLAFASSDGSGSAEVVGLADRLKTRAWYRASVRVDARSGTATLEAIRLPATPLDAAGTLMRATAAFGRVRAEAATPLVIGAAFAGRSAGGGCRPAEGFFGRIEAPAVYVGALDDEDTAAIRAGARPSELRRRSAADWDFSLEIGGTSVIDRSAFGIHGVTRNLPLRGVRGITWSGRELSWRHAPDEYAAIEFHGDDLGDCDWQTDLVFEIPADLPSGVYALRVRLGEGPASSVADGHEDYVPFFVAPGRAGPTAEVAFLMPTNTYLAYGNVREWAAALDESELSPEELFADAFSGPGFIDYSLTIRNHAELGSSTYDHHADGTPIHTSTWLRPLLNLRPKSVLWTLCADLLIADWLESLDVAYDVITDDLLDDEGIELLRDYRVVLTGNHPEYLTTREMDAIETYLSGGGRLMYLGGNGFYWRCARRPDIPGTIEIRRGRVGTATWASDVGESDLAFSAEPGGLWRELGRPPQQLVGVGFIAEGKDDAVYRLMPDVRTSRAGFLLRDVDSDLIGTTGIFGTAVAQEIDRSDRARGTPEHAVVVARSTGHTSDMLFAIEEMRPTHPVIADYLDETYCEVVFFEIPGGGAVFSVGSMAWVGSLRSDPGVAVLTRNALDRMRDPEPFQIPEHSPSPEKRTDHE